MSDTKELSAKDAESKQPRTKDRAATENSLLEAASEVFSRKGYENATTKEISQTAGCSEALIHRYFQSKEGLFLALIDKHKEEDVRRNIETLPMKDSILEEARQILRSRIVHFRECNALVRIIIPRAILEPAFRKDFEAISGRKRAMKALEDRLRAYAAAGKMRSDVNPGSAAELLSMMCFQLGFMRKEVYFQSDSDIERLLEDFAQMFADGVT